MSDRGLCDRCRAVLADDLTTEDGTLEHQFVIRQEGIVCNDCDDELKKGADWNPRTVPDNNDAVIEYCTLAANEGVTEMQRVLEESMGVLVDDITRGEWVSTLFALAYTQVMAGK